MKRMISFCLLWLFLCGACCPVTAPVRASQTTQGAVTVAPTPKSTGLIALPCKLQEVFIQIRINQMGRCRVDQDCVVDRKVSMGCPFGCNFLRNRSYDGSAALGKLNAKIDAYRERCPICVYECTPIDEANIGCRENHCVDLGW